ncbi:MAG: SIR2 family protein [Saprospiraceae bacterium]
MIDKHILRADLKRLNEAYKRNNLVIFVGAGVSMNSNIPSWGSLVNELAKELPKSFQNDSDKLRTVQLYKNNRGEKEYLDKVRSVLKHNKTTPNALHKAILDLSPEHIITTNYDDLIEQEVLNSNKLYYPITKDKDLTYATHNKFIIKMHGDLSVGNIVLSEEDYINYSENFPLIETFVKSLFTSKLILFIGFSFTDYNLKVITSKVKNILQADFQPMYLFNPENPDLELQKYYEKQGIKYISYHSELDNIKDNFDFFEKIEIQELSYYKAIHNYNFLKSIKYYKSIEGELTSQHIMERLNDFVKNSFDEINILEAKNLVDLAPLSLKNCHLGNGSLSFEHKELLLYRNKLKNCFSAKREFLEKYKNLHEEIIQKMYFNGIYSISQKDFEPKRKYKSLRRWAKFDEDNLDVYYNLDFVKSLDTINKLKINETTDISIAALELPFLQFKMGYRYEAYKAYKELSKLSWKQGKYVLYFICQFNLKSLQGSFWLDNTISKKERDLIYNELKGIDLNEILNSINFENEIYYKILYSLKNFKHIFNRFKTISKGKEDIQKSKRSADNGGFSMNSDIENVWSNIHDIWNFCNNNYILSEHYGEHKFIYQKAIESAFISYSIKDNTDSKMQTSKLSKFNSLHLIIMLFNYKSDDLIKKLNEHQILDIEITEEASNKLNLYTKNLLSSLKNLKKFTNKTKETILNVFNSLLVFYSRRNLDKETIDNIINLFIQNSQLFTQSNKELRYFLSKHSDVIECKNIEKLLFLSIKNRYYFNNTLTLQLASILHYRNDKYQIQGKDILDLVSKKYFIMSQTKQEYQLSIHLYHIMPKKYQKKISKHLNESFKSLFEHKDTGRFSAAYREGIILKKKVKITFVKYCESYFANKRGYSSREPSMIDTLKMIDNNNELINLKKIKNLVPTLRFILKPNKFKQINTIEADWFDYLNDEELQSLTKPILNRLKKLVADNPDNKGLLKILLKT